MNNKPIIIVGGEPNSVFLEIFFKSLKSNKYKSPLIIICCKELLEKQMKKLNFFFKINTISKNMWENYGKILILMSPFIPHFTNECLNSIGQKDLGWPTVAEDQLIDENINFVVQINGKKRALLKVKRDMDETKILREIHLNKDTEKLLRNQKIRKTIFVSNRLINIII